ncbi:probable methyltransferase-like protein 25 isoform X2 [Phyllobates terribilis]|uniref:probable methyltransferase-like protein 25 isoform X2 n=1 Tax=Phyllobates terribilis TaxID=111132 RepID=UPI003CCB6D21
MFACWTAPSKDKVKESMEGLLQFLQMTAHISGAHTVEFYTEDIWKNNVGVSPESVLSMFSQQQLSHCEFRDVPDMTRIFSPATNQLVNLESFVEAARYNSLMNSGLCTTIDEILESFASQRTDKLGKGMKTDQFMNDKKSHEVVIMAQLVEALAKVCGVKQESIMVGLHTCGDLAPNTLRIFISKPEMKAVCSVGCCYHFLSEQFEHLEEDPTEGLWGFPMSQYLKERCWHIGRNARMSACLALERVAVGQGLPTESLFYRAVLQVICKEVFGITQRSYSLVPQSKNILQIDQRVGKIFSKSSSFTDYVRKSLKKFGQDDSRLSDQEIMGYYQKYELRRNELEAFNRLKVFLAPCIEALILLDRLGYLREQENLAWSGLVKLFDPVKSPRCYAVVSLKQP